MWYNGKRMGNIPLSIAQAEMEKGGNTYETCEEEKWKMGDTGNGGHAAVWSRFVTDRACQGKRSKH